MLSGLILSLRTSANKERQDFKWRCWFNVTRFPGTPLWSALARTLLPLSPPTGHALSNQSFGWFAWGKHRGKRWCLPETRDPSSTSGINCMSCECDPWISIVWKLPWDFAQLPSFTEWRAFVRNLWIWRGQDTHITATYAKGTYFMSTLEQSIIAMKNCRKKCILSLLHIITVPGSSIGYCHPSSPNTITPQLTSPQDRLSTATPQEPTDLKAQHLAICQRGSQEVLGASKLGTPRVTQAIGNMKFSIDLRWCFAHTKQIWFWSSQANKSKDSAQDIEKSWIWDHESTEISNLFNLALYKSSC